MRQSKYTKGLLEEITKGVFSVSQTLRNLGLKPTGGNYSMIKNRIKYHNIDISHFTGQGWARGKTEETDAIVRCTSQKNRISDDKVFIKNGHPLGRNHIKKRLLKKGWILECEICKLTDWLNNPISLHLDHINGDSNDNRFENLRFICPNCHQQTETWGNPNKKQ